MSSIRKHNKKLNRNSHNGLLSKAYKYGKLRGVKVVLYVEYSEKQELVSFKSHKDFDLEQILEKVSQALSERPLSSDMMLEIAAQGPELFTGRCGEKTKCRAIQAPCCKDGQEFRASRRCMPN
jgi:hypothetical protein